MRVLAPTELSLILWVSSEMMPLVSGKMLRRIKV